MINGKKPERKNIRQAYQKLEKEHETLWRDYLELQRLLKRILLTGKSEQVLFYDHRTARYYTLQELDNMKLAIKNNTELERVEIKLL